MGQTNKYGPFVWVVLSDQNPKFGMAYILNSNAIGMRYNDSTSLVSNAEFLHFKYFDSVAYKQNPSQKQQVFSFDQIPK